MKNEVSPDVLVIGGGPAGLMAAGQAALNGSYTLLIEKMEQLGRKLHITGMGRCNLTNTAELNDFLPHFGRQGQFLRQAFTRFFNEDLVEFMHQIGVPVVVERGGRVFPADGNAQVVTEKLLQWVQGCGAVVRCRCAADKLVSENERIISVVTRDNECINCDRVILAAGGASYTGTGSTGDGYRMAKALGHSLVPLRPALVPIKTRGDTARLLQGLTLHNVGVSAFYDGKPARHEFGEVLFTHFGLSGPVILTMSAGIVDALIKGNQVEISIDLKPALDEQKLDARLLRELDTHGKKQFRSMLKTLLPQKMISQCTRQIGIPEEKVCHQVTSEERQRLREWLKDVRLSVSGHLPLEAAMVTAGGISLSEVDPRTMQSKLVSGLYFAGEVLDLAADTGGYNLQAAFSTGWLAGISAAREKPFRVE